MLQRNLVAAGHRARQASRAREVIDQRSGAHPRQSGLLLKTLAIFIERKICRLKQRFQPVEPFADAVAGLEAGSLPELQARQETDIARRAADAFLRDALRLARTGET